MVSDDSVNVTIRIVKVIETVTESHQNHGYDRWKYYEN